jgi:hypothetical protein
MKNRIYTLGDLMFLVLIVYLVMAKNWWFMNADGDILWHMKMGEWFIEHKTWYLDRELFSYLFEFREWPYLSWLGDVIFAAINKGFGFKGLVIFTNLLIVTSMYMIYRYLVKKGVNIFIVLLIMWLGLELPASHWIVRNHIFGHIFLVIWYIVIERYYEGKDKYLIWILPVLNVIWVNIHGSYLYGMTIPAFFCYGSDV